MIVNNPLADRLNRALNRQGPQHPEARRIASERTTRELHPTLGSRPLMQEATSGGRARALASLNTATGEKLFCFGVPGFGWGEGQLEGLPE